MGTILRREIKAYFSSPIGYILLAAFWGLSGWYFYTSVLYRATAELRNVYNAMGTISIFLMALVSVLHFVNPNSFIHFKAHAWKLKGYIFKNITLIGMSPFLMNLAAAGVVGILNKQLLHYGGDYAVGAYGICNTYGNFLVLMIIGVCQGMQPIAGYNYGARHGERLKHVYTLTMWICVAIGLAGSVISCLIPGAMMRVFTTDSHLIEIGKTALRYSMVMFPLIGFTIVNSNFFQSIDKPWVAIVTSLSRQVIFLVPMCYLIPYLFVNAGLDGLHGVWFSLTCSDVFGAILAAGSTLGALLGTGLSARIDADARLSASRLIPPALGAQAAALLALLLVPRLGIVTTAAFTLFVAYYARGKWLPGEMREEAA